MSYVWNEEKKCVTYHDGSLIKPMKWTDRINGIFSCSLEARYDLGSKSWLNYLTKELKNAH